MKVSGSRTARLAALVCLAVLIPACGPSPWETASEAHPESVAVALGQAYDQEALISYFNEDADKDWIKDCESATELLEAEGAMLLHLAEQIEAGERFALGGQGRELTDWSDETWANFLALTFRAVELGC